MTTMLAHTKESSHALTGEEGAVLVTVALALPVLLLFVAFVVDVGNWFAHHRHLQTQADAAAFAGALEWGGCFGDQATANAAIDAMARQYSGDASGSYNEQIGGTSPDDVHFVLNEDMYYEDRGPVDETVVEELPCDAGMVDVKMTETDLPLFFKLLPFDSVDYIDTHARVEIFQRDRVSGALPFGVPDPNPKVGRVIFVDESNPDENGNPTVLAEAPLAKQEPQDDLSIWDNSAAPVALPVNSEHIGVRVALGGASSTTCGDPLVECYDADPAGNGILHVRGWSTDGSGAQPNNPVARSVQLTTQTGGCTDPYFVNTTAQCGVGVRAEVDFGDCTQLNNVGPKVTANRAGSNTNHTLTLTDCSGSTSIWETSGVPIPVNPGEGPVNIELRWAETKGSVGQATCSDKGNNPCKGSFGNVQRTFGATNERTGPIRMAQLWENGVPGANSLQQCPSSDPCHAVVARIGIDLNLENAKDVDDEPVTLKTGGGDGPLTQMLDCDPAVGLFKDEIALGCSPEYTINEGTVCPATNGALWELPQPWECVGVEQGEKTAFAQGLNQRVHGDSTPTECVSPNFWTTNFPNFIGDPRVVDLFLTPFGTYDEAVPNKPIPVTGFAKFYITGWHNSDQTCPGDDTYPPDDPAGAKELVGHFISYVEPVNDGTAGDDPCDPTQLGSCVPVMTE